MAPFDVPDPATFDEVASVALSASPSQPPHDASGWHHGTVSGHGELVKLTVQDPIGERTLSGLAPARAPVGAERGPLWTPEKRRTAMYRSRKYDVATFARVLGVRRATVRRDSPWLAALVNRATPMRARAGSGSPDAVVVQQILA